MVVKILKNGHQKMAIFKNGQIDQKVKNDFEKGRAAQQRAKYK